ncbi:DNA-directed RNA polymerase subunit omega [Sulfurospirillum arcachonense]|uniref:DNA-directed RNA polymerase subunit omega n=1 Tax=Sulfurospirillum arcachonense TaxID=57666 RepID=UPI000468C506|nr:DNA-directed RNA polymerase subunit omega [Sulfurospirillum arcachonense]
MRTEQITAKALKYVDNDRYKLSLLISKRAEQLSNGAEPLVKLEDKNSKVTDIALLEVAEGKVSIKSFLDDEE